VQNELRDVVTPIDWLQANLAAAAPLREDHRDGAQQELLPRSDAARLTKRLAAKSQALKGPE